MNRDDELLRVGSFCAEKVPRNWHRGKVLRVAKRKFSQKARYPALYQRYFVVGVGDDVGFGCWLQHEQLRSLTALEQLALQCE